MKRKCEICGGSKTEFIYKQQFVVINKKDPFTYSVVVCKKCGFVFATDYPEQKELEKFYKQNTKYAYQAHHTVMPETIMEFHQHCFRFVQSYMQKQNTVVNKRVFRILDIGCASGYFLNIFKNNGYIDVLGIDPSPECSVIAKESYRLKVLSKTLSEYSTRKTFDLIIFGSVLEHISDLKINIAKATSLLKNNGYLFVSVPDSEHFGSKIQEPYLEFSLEHMNFFTKRSMINLLSQWGFTYIKSESYHVGKTGLCALNILVQKTGKKHKIVFDAGGKVHIQKYIDTSFNALKPVKKIIGSLVKSNEKIVIWGVGSLTSRLLATTDLKKANTIFFVDSNTSLHNQTIIGKKIYDPKKLKGRNETVLILSYMHGQDIKKTLRNTYHYKGKVFVLYQ